MDAGPAICQVIPPVGAVDPATPINVAVNVIGAPKLLESGAPATTMVGITWATEIVIGSEFAAS